MAEIEVECEECDGEGLVESGILCGGAGCSCDGFSGGCTKSEPCDECEAGVAVREETSDELLARTLVIVERVNEASKSVTLTREVKLLSVMGEIGVAELLTELVSAIEDIDCLARHSASELLPTDWRPDQ